jgi:hypothetical protein
MDDDLFIDPVGADWFVGIKEGLHEGHRFRLRAQIVRAEYAARQ